eukprot:1141043-Pelagomonas_calceolata.AAC.4
MQILKNTRVQFYLPPASSKIRSDHPHQNCKFEQNQPWASLQQGASAVYLHQTNSGQAFHSRAAHFNLIESAEHRPSAGGYLNREKKRAPMVQTGAHELHITVLLNQDARIEPAVACSRYVSRTVASSSGVRVNFGL